MTTLVTGATGLLGNNVVRTLLERGRAVRVLVRAGGDARPLAGLDVEIVHGDVRDAASVRHACRGVSVVIHAAGWVHIGWSGAATARDVNVKGSRNVARAALQCGARMVHVSSINALGLGSRHQPASEETPHAGQVACPYMVTKRESEAVVRQAVAQGLQASIVNPAFMLGPWDWKPSSGRMMLTVARSFTPVSPRGGCSVCDVRDVTAGILAAAERGQPGRNYILAGENMTYFDLWRMLARTAAGKGPWKRVGRVVNFVGGRVGDAMTRYRGREPAINSAALKISSQYHYYSSQRAIDELGYRPRPPTAAASAAWHWFRQQAYA